MTFRTHFLIMCTKAIQTRIGLGFKVSGVGLEV